MLPVIWTVFAVLVVGAFLMIAAYWLDVQDRPDLAAGARIGWSAAADGAVEVRPLDGELAEGDRVVVGLEGGGGVDPSSAPSSSG